MKVTKSPLKIPKYRFMARALSNKSQPVDFIQIPGEQPRLRIGDVEVWIEFEKVSQ